MRNKGNIFHLYKLIATIDDTKELLSNNSEELGQQELHLIRDMSTLRNKISKYLKNIMK